MAAMPLGAAINTVTMQLRVCGGLPDARFRHPVTFRVNGWRTRVCRWRAGFATPRQVAVLGRHPTRKTRQVRFVVVLELRHVNEADMSDGFRRVQIEQQLVNELAAQTSVADGQAFQFDQPFEVDAHLRQAPAGGFAQFLAAKGGRATGPCGALRPASS